MDIHIIDISETTSSSKPSNDLLSNKATIHSVMGERKH